MNADVTEDSFGAMVDRTGLSLTAPQKAVLFKAWPMYRTLIARGTPPMPREAEMSVMFDPEIG